MRCGTLTTEQALLIAPPTAAMPFQHIDFSTRDRIHAVWCDDDDFVDSHFFADNPKVQSLTLNGGGHFFAGQAENLASAVVSTLTRVLSANKPRHRVQHLIGLLAQHRMSTSVQMGDLAVFQHPGYRRARLGGVILSSSPVRMSVGVRSRHSSAW